MTTLGNVQNPAPGKIPSLYTKEIQDLYIRKNFQSLDSYFSLQNQLVNFKFFEIVLTAATSSVQTISHGLGYTPKDIVISQVTGSGEIQFLFGSFTNTTISYTATGACRVRFFVGTYFADSSSVTAQPTDIQTVVSTPETSTQNTLISVTGNYTMLGTEYLVRVTTTGLGASFGANITLPAPAQGLVVRIQKADNNTNPVTIVVSNKASVQIVPNNSTSINLTARGQEVEMISDGVNWIIYSAYAGA